MIQNILQTHSNSLCNIRCQKCTEGKVYMTCIAVDKENPYYVLQYRLQLLRG